jgi:hypothetical protein
VVALDQNIVMGYIKLGIRRRAIGMIKVQLNKPSHSRATGHPAAGHRSVLILIIYCLMSSTLLADGGSPWPLDDIASWELLRLCDSLGNIGEESSDDTDTINTAYLRIMDSGPIEVNNDSLFAIIIACREYGELIIFKSIKDIKVKARCSMNIPAYHAILGEVLDINNDEYDEIRINLSAGAHGFYSYFVSVFKDSLSLIKTEAGNYDFFAMRGNISLQDTDNDGTMEILVDTPLKYGQKENYTIYKWNGRFYAKHKEIER